MATSIASPHISGGSNLKTREFSSSKCNSLGSMPRNAIMMKPKRLGTNHKFAVRADYRNGDGGRGGGDFVAGFILGGAVCGTLAYIFAPQIRRSLLNEDEYGFRKARRPIYYDDDGLEKTRQTLNAKLGQLNAAIDNISTRLRGGKSVSSMPAEPEPEVEATM